MFCICIAVAMCVVCIVLYCMYVCILGEHLVKAVPFVPPFPCDKIDNNNNNTVAIRTVTYE